MFRRSLRLSLVAAVAVVGAVTAALPAAASPSGSASATAAASAPPPVAAAYEVPMGAPAGGETGSTFGSSDGSGPQIRVSTATTLFVLRFNVSDTDCWLYAADGTELASEVWYGSGDEDDVRRFAVPAGSITDGARYAVRCRDGAEVSTYLTWNVIGTTTRIGTTETLTTAPELVVSRDTKVFYFTPPFDPVGVLSPGERVRVTAPKGTWTPAGQVDAVTGVIASPVTGNPVALSDVVISADGSSASFTVPTDLPYALGSEVVVTLERLSTVPRTAGAPGQTNGIRYFNYFTLAAKASSRTSLALSASTVAFTKPRATVAVTCDGSVVPAGAVVIYVDGYVVARSSITVAMKGKVVVPMPKVSKGTHSVVAVFQTSVGCTGSISAPKPLKVLR